MHIDHCMFSFLFVSLLDEHKFFSVDFTLMGKSFSWIVNKFIVEKVSKAIRFQNENYYNIWVVLCA